MQCSEAQKIVSAWLDNELDPANADALEAHLSICPPCSAYRDGLRGLALDAFLAPEPSAGFVARFERQLAATGPRRSSMLVYRATAGALGLAATVAGFSVGLKLPAGEPASAIVANAADSSEMLVRDSIDPFGDDTVEGVLLAMINESGEG
jgi:predicted anti-sigma-YlaC factor YlaD